MNIIITVMTASLLKPRIASWGVTSPNRSSSPRLESATASIRSHSKLNARNVKTMTAMRIQISIGGFRRSADRQPAVRRDRHGAPHLGDAPAVDLRDRHAGSVAGVGEDVAPRIDDHGVAVAVP